MTTKKQLIQQLDKLDREIENMRLLIRDTYLDIEDKKKEKKLIFEQLKKR